MSEPAYTEPSAPESRALQLAIQQRAREPVAMARAAEKLRGLQGDKAASRLVDAARSASTVGKRVLWLQRAASTWGRAVAEVSACRLGCSHCCHIPVTVSRTEAELIGRATGRRLKVPRALVRASDVEDGAAKQDAERILREGHEGVPCVFLANGSCGIYEHRPFACRVLFNLDDDPMLCEVVPGRPAEVPYADATFLRVLYAISQPNAELADLRDFFD